MMYNSHRWGMHEQDDGSSPSGSATSPDKPITARDIWKMIKVFACCLVVILVLLWHYISQAQWWKCTLIESGLILLLIVWAIVLTIKEKRR